MKTKKILMPAFTLFCCMLFWSCNNNSSNTQSESYQEKVSSVEDIEKSQPENFLKTSGTYNANLINTKFIIKCEISNTATVATYKDVVLEFTYYSKTDSPIKTIKHIVYEVFKPHETKTFAIKLDVIKDGVSLGWEVIDATPI